MVADVAGEVSGRGGADGEGATGVGGLGRCCGERDVVKGGEFVAKAFQGEGFDPWLAEVKQRFQRVAVRKPAASRARSREVYVVARNFAPG